MENPFEIILERLDRIERILNQKQVIQEQTETQIMNVEELAKYLGMSTSTIYKKTSDMEIPRIKKGKKLYFIKEEIDEWLKKGKQMTNEEIEQEAANYLIKNKFKF